MKERFRTALRWLLALAYGYAGWAHLARPTPFLAITPPWVPAPEIVVANLAQKSGLQPVSGYGDCDIGRSASGIPDVATTFFARKKIDHHFANTQDIHFRLPHQRELLLRVAEVTDHPSLRNLLCR